MSEHTLRRLREMRDALAARDEPATHIEFSIGQLLDILIAERESKPAPAADPEAGTFIEHFATNPQMSPEFAEAIIRAPKLSTAGLVPYRPLLTEDEAAPYQQAGRRDVLHELRAWHESQAAENYGGAKDAHTASIAEIDRLMEVEKAKI